MRTSHTKHRRLTRLLTGWLIAGILAVGAKAVSATSYISVEPVPNVDVIGQANLNSLRGIGYANLELWSQRLLNECGAVDDVIGALTANGAITTITATNTRFTVAAGGFEGATNPSFVFTVRDAGANSASQADVNVLSNALGYVQSQGGTVQRVAVRSTGGRVLRAPGDDRSRAVQRHVRGLHADQRRLVADEQLDAVPPAGREQEPFYFRSFRRSVRRSARDIRTAQEQWGADHRESRHRLS
jgi:hypothetical protein